MSEQPKPKHHEFRIRIPPDLWAAIEQSRGEKSLNRQINEWLRAMAEPDDASRLAAAFRPIMASLSDSDRAAFVWYATAAIGSLAKAMPRKKSGKARNQA